MSENEVVSQWLDPDGVRALAEGLLAKTPVSQIPAHESVFGEDFEGFDGESTAKETVPVPVESPTPAPKAATVEPRPAKIVVAPVTPAPQPDLERKVVPPAAIEAKPPIQPDPFRKDTRGASPATPAKKVSPFKVAPTEQAVPVVPPGLPSLPRALDTFAGWLKKQAPIQAAFLCDPTGKVVFDDIGSEKLIKVARSLLLASISKGAAGSGGLLQVEIDKDRMMEILPLKSEEGHSITGLVVARPLATEALATIRRSFETALARSSTPGE